VIAVGRGAAVSSQAADDRSLFAGMSSEHRLHRIWRVRGSAQCPLARTVLALATDESMRARPARALKKLSVECRICSEDEISRISRKEIRHEASSIKKYFTTHRSEIAALTRRVQALERQLRTVGRAGERSQPAAANEDSVSQGTRFSARSIVAQRKRLGRSAAEGS